MKKIVLIVDAINFTPEVLDFASGIASLSGSPVTCVFIHDTSYMNNQGVNMLGGQLYVEEIVFSQDEQKIIANTINKNIALFNAECTKIGMTGIARLEKGLPKDIILKESRFADFIIASPLLAFDGEQNVPTAFIKEVLAGAECPVLLSPEQHLPVEEIIVAYDGSKSSTYALKQFCYQLPALCTKKVTVLSVAESDKESEQGTHDLLLSEWIKVHCKDVVFVTLKGNARDVLFNYFMEIHGEKRVLLVAGAFGRNALSRFFKPGSTELVLRTVDIPVFIAHS
jgi:hypothetical protein